MFLYHKHSSWLLRYEDDKLRVDTLPKTFIEQKYVLIDFKYFENDFTDFVLLWPYILEKKIVDIQCLWVILG